MTTTATLDATDLRIIAARRKAILLHVCRAHPTFADPPCVPDECKGFCGATMGATVALNDEQVGADACAVCAAMSSGAS